MPTKGKLRRMTSKTPYDIYKKAAKRKTTRERKSGRFRKRFSAKLRFALAFRSAFRFCYGVCLSGGAKRRHLSMTSTRHGAKHTNLVDQDINSIFIVLPFSFSNEEIDFSMSDWEHPSGICM